MRTLHKAWQDRRPGFTRRVRWYEGETKGGGLSIRLEFEEYGTVWNSWHRSRELAQREYDDFVAHVKAMMEEEADGGDRLVR